MLAFAWTAAGLFVAALAYCAWFYLIVLGRPVEVPAADVPWAVLTNVVLFSVFAVHHSIFARTGAKALIHRLAPRSLERAIYVTIASVMLIGVCALWRPLPGTAWEVPDPARWLMHGVQVAGLALTLRSAGRIDIWDLSGVRQAGQSASPAPSVAALDSASHQSPRSGQAAPSVLEVGGPYGWVRHPIYFGWVLCVFFTPTMTVGRLVFAVVSVAYLVIAIPLEERGLVAEFGEPYREYQRRVRWRLVPGAW